VGQGGMPTQQAELTIVETMMDKDNDLLKRSELLTNDVRWLSPDLSCGKFSASSFHPDRDGLPSATHLHARADSRFGIAKEPGKCLVQDGNDTDVESEDEWFDDPFTDAPKASKTLNAEAIEVSSFHIFYWLFT
jgi:hypothetical protein